MNVVRLITLALLTGSVWAAQVGQRDPHIGYAYPAGGQQGTSFEMTIGGQNLDDVERALVSGNGIRIEIGEHKKPLTMKQLNELGMKLKELRDRKQEAIKKGTEDKMASLDEFKALATKLGFKDLDVAGFMQIRKDLFDPKRQPNPQIAETVSVKVTISATAEPGRRELRLRTPNGFSNPIFIEVGQYPEYREKEPNDSQPDAGLTKLPVIVNGQIMPGDVDRFRFQARKGMNVVAVVSARELTPYLADAVPGWFQATLRLVDASNNEVAYVDDFRFQPDPVLFYQIPADGEYILEIADAIYRGREDFVYRILLGEVPYVTGVYPLGGRAGSPTSVQLEGWNLPSAKTTIDPHGKTSGNLPVSVTRNGKMSNGVPFQLSDLPECMELEPNDQPFAAQHVDFPVIVNGRINRPGDWDIYRFEGHAGDEVAIEVFARRLNSPVDSVVKLTGADGKLIAVNDDVVDQGEGWVTHHADSQVRAKLPADGTYLVHVGDTQRQGGPAYAYRVRIARQEPDFELRVVPSRINAVAGSIVPITVYALRKDGFAGEITCRLHDVPAGLALEGNTIPSGVDQVRMTLTIPLEAPKEPVALRMEGSASIGGKDRTHPATPTEDMMQAFIYHHLLPMNEWLLDVSPGKRKRAITLRVRGDLPVKLIAGDSSTFVIAAPNGPIIKQMAFELDEPPEGFAIKETSVDQEGLRVVVTTDAAKVKAGLKGNLIVQATMEFAAPTKDGKPGAKRNFPVGILPAIPFEVVAKP